MQKRAAERAIAEGFFEGENKTKRKMKDGASICEDWLVAYEVQCFLEPTVAPDAGKLTVGLHPYVVFDSEVFFFFFLILFFIVYLKIKITSKLYIFKSFNLFIY